MVLEFQLSSNVRLNNITDLKAHPLKTYLAQDIACVMGTDGCGLYGTDCIDEQLALTNFLKITDAEFIKMKDTEDKIISRQEDNFIRKSAAFRQRLAGRTVEEYYTHMFAQRQAEEKGVGFEIYRKPSWPVFRDRIRELPWDKYPVVIAGGSFTNPGSTQKVTADERKLLDRLLSELDPEKVFFVIGHRMQGQEKYIADNNPGFDIYSIIPSLMEEKQMKRLKKAQLAGIRLSTESQEMGIYKSFNYEIFERRNCVLFAFDGNSSAANLVQEARNGKGHARIFVYPRSSLLKAKAASLEGYITVNATPQEAIEKIHGFEDNIGTKIQL